MGLESLPAETLVFIAYAALGILGVAGAWVVRARIDIFNDLRNFTFSLAKRVRRIEIALAKYLNIDTNGKDD